MSASLLVLTALLVTVIVCLMVGLLLLVTAIVMFVLGDPISDMPTLAPVCWDRRKARPVPRPMNAGMAGINSALKRLLLLKVLTGLGLGINSCLFSICDGCSLLKTVFLNLSRELARADFAGFLLNLDLLNCIGGVLGSFDFLPPLLAKVSENNKLIPNMLKGNTILIKKCCILPVKLVTRLV